MTHYSKYFSVILDCISNTSHTEQISLVLRYVVLNTTSKKVEVKKSFIAFNPILDSTGEGMYIYICNRNSEKSKLYIKHIRGQEGKHERKTCRDLKRILDADPRALLYLVRLLL